MDESKQLNEILEDIKRGIDRKNDLLLHNHIQGIIGKIAGEYARKNNFKYDAVYQNCVLEFYSLLSTYTFFDDNEGNYRESFLSYLDKYLPLRLNDYYGNYSLFRDNNGIVMLSLDVYDEFDFLDEDLQTKINIREEEIDLNSIKNKLNDLEYKILLFIYEEYTEQEIADKIGCTQQNINYHKNRLFHKLRKFIC